MQNDAIIDTKRATLAAGWQDSYPVHTIELEDQEAHKQNIFLKIFSIKGFVQDLKDSFGLGFTQGTLIFVLSIIGYFSLPIEPSFIAISAPFILACCVDIIFKQYRLISYAPLVVIIFCSGFLLAKINTENYQQNLISPPAHITTIKGFVLESRQRESGSDLIIKPIFMKSRPKEKLPEKIRLFARQNIERPKSGDFVTLLARLSPSGTPALPQAFDFGQQSYFKSIAGIGFILKIYQTTDFSFAEETEKTGLGLQNIMTISINQFRERIGKRIEQSLDGQSMALAKALLIGDRGSIAKEDVVNLRRSGLAHVLAISGMHVLLISGALFAFIRSLLLCIPTAANRLPIEKIAALSGLAAAIGYLLISGMAISTCRAVIMISIFYFAILSNKPALTLQNLLLSAVILLLIWPHSVMQAGFQMSYAAATALILGYNFVRKIKTSRRFNKVFWESRGFFSQIIIKLGKFFGGLLFTSLLAGVATAPFAIFHFQNAAPLSLISNLFAMPIIGFIVMPMGLAALILMPYGLEYYPLQIMAVGLELTAEIAQKVSAHPFSQLGEISFSPMAFLIFIAIIFICLIAKKRIFIFVPILFLLGLNAPTQQFGDILISSQNYTVAVRHKQDSYEIWGRSSLTRNTWEKKLALAPEKDMMTSMDCSKKGCNIIKDNLHILYHRLDEIRAENCHSKQVLILQKKIQNMPADCMEIDYVYTVEQFNKSGGIEIYLPNDKQGNVIFKPFIKAQRPWNEVWHRN